MKRNLVYALIIIAFIGFVDAFYLTAVHYSNVSLPCFITEGCDIVTTSKYSEILGLPVSLLGTFFYLVIFISGLLYVDKNNKLVLKIIHIITFVGFLLTLRFLYLQAIIIKSWCSYCLVSALTSILLFVLSAYLYHKKNLN